MSCNICNKYNISETDLRRMVNDGKLSVTVYEHDKIFSTYKSFLATGLPNREAILKTSEESRLNERTVYRIILEFS